MRTPARPARRLTPAAAALVIGVGLLGLAGCGAGGDSDAASVAAPGSAVVDTQGRPSAGDTSGGVAPDQSAEASGSKGVDGSVAVAPAVAPAVYDRKLARRANIAITVADVDAAAAKVRAIAASAKGLVIAEAISSEPEDPTTGGFSTITISVPTDALDGTLDRLAGLGKVHSRNASTDDVTAQYVDTESRVKTMQASVERVRALMSQATKLGDVVTLEAELSRRQADLDATQSQLAALKDSVALSPVEVKLSTDEQVLQEDDDTGFLAGLKAGWAAFTDSATVLLTALGAMLPFAVVIAVVVVPLVLWLRRRTQPTPGTSVSTAVQPPPVA